MGGLDSRFQTTLREVTREIAQLSIEAQIRIAFFSLMFQVLPASFQQPASNRLLRGPVERMEFTWIILQVEQIIPRRGKVEDQLITGFSYR